MGFDDSVTADPGTADDRINIINSLWQNNVQISPKESELWRAYFLYYTDQCKTALEGDGEHTTVRKHQDVLDIASELEGGRTKSELKQDLVLLDTQNREQNVMKKMAEGSIRLVVRLLAMVDVGPIPHDRTQGHAPLDWSNEQHDLKTLLRNQFKESCSIPDTSKFGRLFNALNIRRYAGLKILWTDNLANHLRLVDDDTALCVFHHVTFLRGQDSTIFPQGLLEETVQTLALLFPRYDKDIQKWLEREARSVQETTCLDLGLLKLDRLMPQDRRIEKFKFWRDELIELKEIFEQPGISSISQFWYDRRNRGQWYTFWIAILVVLLTVFFGLVQSIEGAMQVFKGYHPTGG